MTTPYFAISDGTTTCTFLNGTTPQNYRIESWQPAISHIRKSMLGGAGPYEDVQEHMTISVLGTSVDNCLANLVALQTLIDQADRFYNGENVAVVNVKYAPAGSTVSSDSAPLKAMILGGMGDNVFVMPDSVDYVLTLNKWVANISFSFWRRGAWLNDTGNYQQSAATDNGEIITLGSLAAVSNYSPTDIVITNPGSAGYYSDMMLLIGRTGSIGVISASNMAGATDYTSVNDSTHYARNTNILRFTPTATTIRTSNATLTENLAPSSDLWHVFYNLRNNSNSTTFSLRTEFTMPSNNMTQYLSVPVSAGPAWYYGGTVYGRAFSSATNTIRVSCIASAAADSLDINTIILLSATAPHNTAFIMRQDGAAIVSPISIITAPLSILTPYVADNLLFGTNVLPYSGNAYFSTKGSIDLMFLQNGSDISTNTWRAVASTSVIKNQITATRFSACLVAQ